MSECALLFLFLRPLFPHRRHNKKAMAASALDDCVSKVDNLILEVGKGMDGSDVPRMKVDPDDPWADIWNPPPAVYKVRAWWWRGRGRRRRRGRG